jgi:hypothetical protein
MWRSIIWYIHIPMSPSAYSKMVVNGGSRFLRNVGSTRLHAVTSKSSVSLLFITSRTSNLMQAHTIRSCIKERSVLSTSAWIKWIPGNFYSFIPPFLSAYATLRSTYCFASSGHPLLCPHETTGWRLNKFSEFWHSRLPLIDKQIRRHSQKMSKYSNDRRCPVNRRSPMLHKLSFVSKPFW